MPRSMSETHTPEELFTFAKASVAIAQDAPLTLGLSDGAASARVTLACYFAMCAEIALSELPNDFLNSASDVAARLTVHEAIEYAREQLKLEALRAAQPEYTPRG